MRFLLPCVSLLASLVSATIYQNTQIRADPYPGQATLITAAASQWKTYAPSSAEISYKGRWDSKFISWWSAPGIKFGFTGSNVALSFGNYTDAGVLLAWRIDGQDWQFSNVTANSTYQFVSAGTTGANLTDPGAYQTFEMRVTNWAYGVQLQGVHVDASAKLIQLPLYSKTVEIIGDSLSAGQYATYEGISSWSWGFAEGLGNVEFSIEAYPGICLVDKKCYGNLHGQTYQFYRTSDTSGRAIEIWGDEPELWNFAAHPAADLVVINIGTNDNNSANNVSAPQFQQSYIDLINGIHGVWPESQIIIFVSLLLSPPPLTTTSYHLISPSTNTPHHNQSLWSGFSAVGNTYAQGAGFLPEIENVYSHFADAGYVHYFNTTGILQHNDIGPLYHPTDVGHVKVASHLLQYVKLTFDWVFGATGPEVQSHTLYWNDQPNY